MSQRPPPPQNPHPADQLGAGDGARRPDLQQAVVRPDLRGRAHPDPRADPPTLAFDPASARTEELAHVADDGIDTARIPTVAPDVVAPADDGSQVSARPTGADADGRALAASALLGVVASAVCWFVAARLVPPAAVGAAQLVVSAILFVAGAAQLGSGPGMLHWLPAAGRATGRLVRRALLLVVVVSGLAAAIYGLATPVLADVVGALVTGPVPWLPVFVLAAVAGGVSWLYDALLGGLGRPWWAVWRNGLSGLAQIAAVLVLVAVVGLGADGVVLAVLGPIAAWVVLGSVVIAVRARARGARAEYERLPSRGETLAVLGPIAVTQLAAALLHQQVPVVLNLRFGPETAAVFFIAWQAVLVADLAATFSGHLLAVRRGGAPHRAAKTVSAARLRLVLVALPVLGLGAASATPLLATFGTAYAAADDVLRLLLLGAAFRLVVAHLQGSRHAMGAAGAGWLQLTGTLLVLTMAIVVPVAAGGETTMLFVAGGYAAVQAASAVAALVLPAGRRAEVEVRSP